MTTEEQAKKLLALSYRQSVERIEQAMAGGLRIQNSREPLKPPSCQGEVVGLCGQGGRHPYFIIPPGILQRTLREILDVSERLSDAADSIERAVDGIAAACQELRRQTYFDTGTGCVNDRLPSMVPLLQPEEVWFDGRELPLDVWRLISFEFDLVSSAVSSQVSVNDFAFSAINPNALAFRLLIGQLRNQRARFEVNLQNIPAAWMKGLPQNRTLDVSLARVFFEAGSLLTPLATQDPIKWYSGIRYLHWIDDGTSQLTVRDEFDRDSVDGRYRGLFAEEMAIGLMATILSDVFGFFRKVWV